MAAAGISVTAMRAAGAALIVHCAQIMLGVLKVVLGGDDVAALGLGTRQIQVALIISLRIQRLPRGAGSRALPLLGSWLSLHLGSLSDDRGGSRELCRLRLRRSGVLAELDLTLLPSTPAPCRAKCLTQEQQSRSVRCQPRTSRDAQMVARSELPSSRAAARCPAGLTLRGVSAFPARPIPRHRRSGSLNWRYICDRT